MLELPNSTTSDDDDDNRFVSNLSPGQMFYASNFSAGLGAQRGGEARFSFDRLFPLRHPAQIQRSPSLPGDLSAQSNEEANALLALTVRLDRAADRAAVHSSGARTLATSATSHSNTQAGVTPSEADAEHSISGAPRTSERSNSTS